MKDAAILEVLQKQVTVAVAATTLPASAVKYVGRDFTPPNDQKWLEVVWLPNNRDGDFWGQEQNYRGTLRLILHWPNRSNGAYEPINLLRDIVAPFSKGTMLQDVQIYDNPSSGGVLEQGSENLFPVSIRYQCFKR